MLVVVGGVLAVAPGTIGGVFVCSVFAGDNVCVAMAAGAAGVFDFVGLAGALVWTITVGEVVARTADTGCRTPRLFWITGVALAVLVFPALARRAAAAAMAVVGPTAIITDKGSKDAVALVVEFIDAFIGLLGAEEGEEVG